MFGLFFLEACVSKLYLNKNAYKDSGGAALVVRINFIHFPEIEIIENNRIFKDDFFFFEFKRGQLRHFSMKCEELASKMKKVPLMIGIFRDGDSFPICHTFTHLSGCACDLTSISDDKPAPFTFKGPFDLVDPGDNFAGQLGVDITIASMGRFVITHYGLAPGFFVFKNDPEGSEYKCAFRKASSAELSGGEYRSSVRGDNSANAGNHTMKLNGTLAENLMKDIAGISPAAERLALGRPPPKPPRAPLEDPLLAAERRKTSRKKGKKKGKKKKGKKK